MHAFTILTTIAVVAVATTASVTPRDTLPKANEYKSGDWYVVSQDSSVHIASKCLMH